MLYPYMPVFAYPFCISKQGSVPLRSDKRGSTAEEVVRGRNVIAFFVWAWPSGFVTEAVSLGELLHEEALFGLTGWSTPRTLIPV